MNIDAYDSPTACASILSSNRALYAQIIMWISPLKYQILLHAIPRLGISGAYVLRVLRYADYDAREGRAS